MGEAFIIKRGSISISEDINLTVVGGAIQPTTPKENMIWVNTDTEISGYAFSATEPENPVEGMTWFQTDIFSAAPINIDKKNAVILYPSGCFQYINGAWISKDAQTFINDIWVNWRIYFYNRGNQCTDLTGGWLAKGVLANSSGQGKSVKPAVTQNTDNMTIVFNAAQYGSGMVYTANSIDLTELKLIIIEGEANCPVSNSSVRIAAYSKVPSYRGQYMVANATIIKSGTFKTILDVSALSGEYYLSIDFYNDPSGTNTIVVNKFYGGQYK